MTAQTGIFVQNMPEPDGSGATAKGSRLALAGLLAKNSDGTVRVGVLADGQGAVVTGAAGMSYSIRKHVAVTKLSEAHGPTLVPNDGVVSVSTDPAPGSNSRIDVIWVQQRHLVADGGSDTVNTPLYGVAKGATSATPTAPAIPTGALELGRATVTSGTTSTSGLTITQGPRTTANTGNRDTTSGLLWGAAYDPSIHQMKMHRVTVLQTTSPGGDISLAADLAALFVGVDSIVATNTRIDSAIIVSANIAGNVPFARCYGSDGALLVGYSVRINAIITGWI